MDSPQFHKAHTPWCHAAVISRAAPQDQTCLAPKVTGSVRGGGRVSCVQWDFTKGVLHHHCTSAIVSAALLTNDSSTLQPINPQVLFSTRVTRFNSVCSGTPITYVTVFLVADFLTVPAFFLSFLVTSADTQSPLFLVMRITCCVE